MSHSGCLNQPQALRCLACSVRLGLLDADFQQPFQFAGFLWSQSHVNPVDQAER